MNLCELIAKDFVSAYKAGDGEKVAVLRMLKTAIKNKQVELGQKPSEDEVLALLARQKKQCRESLELFAAAGRKDLAEREGAQLKIIEAYLPSMLTRSEISESVDSILEEMNVSEGKDAGRVIGRIMSIFKGRVDGNKVAQMVRSKLPS